MGILNVTPDSFSDGGYFLAQENALAHARQMVEEGAAIIDVGGESTRPGAEPVSIEQELARVIPVIKALAAELAVPISIDTSKPELMRAAVANGAGMINDVRALRSEGALAAASEINRQASIPICLMHMAGDPATMQGKPGYIDVVGEVKIFLAERIASCVKADIPYERLLIDPGFGFGKALAHNLTLLNRLDEFTELGLPILVGLSRKSMLADLLDAPQGQRLHGSLALATLAAWQGAAIVRAHDVRATVEVVKVCNALKQMEAKR